ACLTLVTQLLSLRVCKCVCVHFCVCVCVSVCVCVCVCVCDGGGLRRTVCTQCWESRWCVRQSTHKRGESDISSLYCIFNKYMYVCVCVCVFEASWDSIALLGDV